MEVQENRIEFIRLFIKYIIAHSLPLEDKKRLARIQNKIISLEGEIRPFQVNAAQENKQQETRQLREVKQQNVLQKTIMAREKSAPIEFPYPFNKPPSRLRIPINKNQQMPIPLRRAGAMTAKIPEKPVPTPAQTIPKPLLSRPANMQKIEINSLAKIDSLLNDPAVQTIECPGPGKQILVYKAGVIQTTNLLLSIEEINNIMKEISEKTRIPIISGIFKAAFGDLITTAVISDFVGTRFMIQKKSAIQQPGAAV